MSTINTSTIESDEKPAVLPPRTFPQQFNAYLDNRRKEFFHLKHEALTDLIYRLPHLLPDRYVFILTNLCNLTCDFCFQKKDLREDRMTTSDWLTLAKQLPFYSRVTLTGGEPLMFPGFEEVFSYVAKRYECNMISNGLLLRNKKSIFF